jgi:4-aminobutyrate aminotransferase
MIAFRGAFHGRTFGALSLTSSKVTQRAGFAPLVPGVHHVDYPYCVRCPLRPADGTCCRQPLDQLERLFQHTVAPHEVAAIVVEPILGEGGYVLPPPEFLRDLRQLTQRHGILLVADEIQSGLGRTGKMFAVEHVQVEPDIICLAKGIASGMPLGAIIAREEVMTWPRGSHASTFGGNPVACAAALATLDLLEESLIENAARLGPVLQSGLREVARRHPVIGDIRGQGLMVGAELVRPESGAPPGNLGHAAPELQHAVIQRCFEKGLLLLGCGTSTVRFCPPLVVDRGEVETAVRLFGEALDELAAQET